MIRRREPKKDSEQVCIQSEASDGRLDQASWESSVHSKDFVSASRRGHRDQLR